MSPTTPACIDTLRIDGDRLWASLMELARIGATPKGGVCRLALTDLDRQGRDLVSRSARQTDPVDYRRRPTLGMASRKPCR